MRVSLEGERVQVANGSGSWEDEEVTGFLVNEHQKRGSGGFIEGSIPATRGISARRSPLR